MLKRWLYVVAGLLLVGVLAWRVTGAMRSEVKPAAPPKRPPVSVEVGDVRPETIRDVQQLSGEVLPSYRYVVGARGAGRVLQIAKRVGDRVSEGEVVARIDDAEYRQAVVEAEAALRSARASLAEIRVQMELAARELGARSRVGGAQDRLPRGAGARRAPITRPSSPASSSPRRRSSSAKPPWPAPGSGSATAVLTASRPGIVGRALRRRGGHAGRQRRRSFGGRDRPGDRPGDRGREALRPHQGRPGGRDRASTPIPDRRFAGEDRPHRPRPPGGLADGRDGDRGAERRPCC